MCRGHLDAVRWASKAENADGVLDTFNFGTGTGSTVLEVHCRGCMRRYTTSAGGAYVCRWLCDVRLCGVRRCEMQA